MIHRAYLLFCLILLSAVPIHPAMAQTIFQEIPAEHAAGEWITFRMLIQTDTPVESALVFFQARNDTQTGIGQARITPVNEGSYELSYTHRIADQYLRPFSEIDYHWEVTFKGGEKNRSSSYEHFYDDNRFAWNSLEERPFRVHWYEGGGDVLFAQQVIDVAQAGFDRAQDFLPLYVPQFTDIYIYTDSTVMQKMLGPSSREWVAGHADPDLGVIVAALPPGPDQRLLLQQRIPHELMHLLLYQYADPGYDRLPVWLTEGLASLVELYPNSDYEVMLDNAVESGGLLPLTSLCRAFPSDAASALLAYAQSASFVRYLHGEYGLTGLERLVLDYANGLDCERGPQQSFGRSLSQLERSWRSDVLAENMTATAINNLLPWGALALAVFATPVALMVLGLRRRHS